MNTAQEAIRAAMNNATTVDVGVQPSTIVKTFLNPDKVEEFTDCHVNEAHRERLTELLATGWKIFLMQTEFGASGHYVMAYLAKMKTN